MRLKTLGFFLIVSALAAQTTLPQMISVPCTQALATYPDGGRFTYLDYPTGESFCVDVPAYIRSAAITYAANGPGVAQSNQVTRPGQQMASQVSFAGDLNKALLFNLKQIARQWLSMQGQFLAGQIQ